MGPRLRGDDGGYVKTDYEMSLSIRFQHIVKDFGPVRVLHGVDFALEPGRSP
jgi:ABC-type sugar transport system ATPase subunit